MNPIIFKIVHLAGVMGLFTSLGAILAYSSKSDASSCSSGCGGNKRAAMLHGISLLLILIAGFAILKKPPMAMHWWQVKLLIWVFFGAAPVLAKKKILSPCVLMLICIALGIFAAWLGLAKPF